MATVLAPKPYSNISDSSSSAANMKQLTWSNNLLAGYLAHEFLTKGTLFGSEAESVIRLSKKPKLEEPIKEESEIAVEREEEEEEKQKTYAEVTHLLKVEGTHLPGNVNLSQLARG